MGSPPTPYNSTVRLIVYPTGLGTSQFQRLFMLKGEFFCNVSSRYHFFTHGSYIDVKSRVESIYGSEKPNRRLLSELEAKKRKAFLSFQKLSLSGLREYRVQQNVAKAFLQFTIRNATLHKPDTRSI